MTHKFSDLKQHIYYLTVSVGQQSGYDSAGFSPSGSFTVASKVLAGAVGSSEGSKAVSGSKLPGLLVEFCSVGLRPLVYLAVGWGLPLVPYPEAPSDTATGFIKAHKPVRYKASAFKTNDTPHPIFLLYGLEASG